MIPFIDFLINQFFIILDLNMFFHWLLFIHQIKKVHLAWIPTCNIYKLKVFDNLNDKKLGKYFLLKYYFA